MLTFYVTDDNATDTALIAGEALPPGSALFCAERVWGDVERLGVLAQCPLGRLYFAPVAPVGRDGRTLGLGDVVGPMSCDPEFLASIRSRPWYAAT